MSKFVMDEVDITAMQEEYHKRGYEKGLRESDIETIKRRGFVIKLERQITELKKENADLKEDIKNLLERYTPADDSWRN